MHAALGFRPHTGWATAIALGGEVLSPVVLARRRLDLSDPAIPHQAFHTARELNLQAAQELVQQAEKTAREAAVQAIGELLADLDADDHEVIAAGIPEGTARIPSALPQILASHPYLHAAEGQLFREALALAAGHHGLHVVRVPHRELAEEAQHILGRDDESLRRALAELGRPLGPPWRQDERDATLAAWLALAGS